MEAKKIFIIIGIIILIVIGFFYAYLKALGSAWVTNKPDKRPFFVTTKPIIIKNILLPEGTKIIYNKKYFWEKYEQKELLNEKDITSVFLKEGTTINWGGVPITSIVKFFNSEMKGFSVYPDFDKLNENKKTQFSNLWLSCNTDLGITVENTNDWSFNKTNILDVESCGVNNQRYFKEDKNQQRFLDDLYNELMIIKD
ncbi:hypothetical protein ATE84_0873 [Aquimarina sp. MAR_2010_214]|uniref:hypothetical protein n=1 Tax=Aquimarina sp. MAR_2010_214 TaxID=1250026 RepID=UPI000C70AA75|nr:hypothetical protein [Aquimarina sp. MAR_2010_214]PKV48858.1 hypothetical protein ATE84_0873 [Aquimarina sp. MAR_2010_214]